MTSILCTQNLGGKVEVHHGDLVEELIIDSNDHIKTMYLSKSDAARKRCRSKRPQSTPNPGKNRQGNMDSEALIGHTLKLQDWLNEKSVRSVQEKSDLEAKNTRKMYTSVLDNENSFVKELDNLVEYKEMLNLRKKELLHKRWTEHVHEPIRRQIDQQMNGANYQDLGRRKRMLHKEYLEHVNKKGHVFLDTYAPDEYYPLALHGARPAPLVAETGALQDPLLNQGRDRNSEDRVIFHCMTGSTLTDKDLEAIRLPRLPLVPLGRHGTGCNSWLEMPMGDIESPVRMASRRRMKGVFNNTKIDFDAWSKHRFNNRIVEEELQTQKKRPFEMPFPRSAYAIDPETTIAPALPQDRTTPLVPTPPHKCPVPRIEGRIQTCI